jgi:hypothetical protein
MLKIGTNHFSHTDLQIHMPTTMARIKSYTHSNWKTAVLLTVKAAGSHHCPLPLHPFTGRKKDLLLPVLPTPSWSVQVDLKPHRHKRPARWSPPSQAQSLPTHLDWHLPDTVLSVPMKRYLLTHQDMVHFPVFCPLLTLFLQPGSPSPIKI